MTWLCHRQGTRRTDMLLSEEFSLFMGHFQKCPTAKAKEADAGGHSD